MIRRLTTVLASLVVGSAVAVAGLATPASAAVNYGYGQGTEIVFCDPINHTIEVDTTITSSWQTMTYPGQLTAARVWYYSYVMGKWYTKGWRTAYAFRTALYEETVSMPAGRFAVYVDFGWNNGGSNWVYGHEYAPVYNQRTSSGSWYRSTTCYA